MGSILGKLWSPKPPADPGASYHPGSRSASDAQDRDYRNRTMALFDNSYGPYYQRPKASGTLKRPQLVADTRQVAQSRDAVDMRHNIRDGAKRNVNTEASPMSHPQAATTIEDESKQQPLRDEQDGGRDHQKSVKGQTIRSIDKIRQRKVRHQTHRFHGLFQK